MQDPIRLSDGSRPSLFFAIARMIERYDARIPASTVLGNTRVKPGVLMQIQMLFRVEGVIGTDDFIEGTTPDQILESIENMQKARAMS